jgi:hypothetical protein
MKEMILLGAGASVEAGVPATYEMTKRLVDLFGQNSNEDHEKFNHVLKFVVGGLLMRKGKNGENPFDGVNVEDDFNAIDLLANRENLEADSFIGSWHPLVEELDTIRPPKRLVLTNRLNRPNVALLNTFITALVLLTAEGVSQHLEGGFGQELGGFA